MHCARTCAAHLPQTSSRTFVKKSEVVVAAAHRRRSRRQRPFTARDSLPWTAGVGVTSGHPPTPSKPGKCHGPDAPPRRSPERPEPARLSLVKIYRTTTTPHGTLPCSGTACRAPRAASRLRFVSRAFSSRIETSHLVRAACLEHPRARRPRALPERQTAPAIARRLVGVLQYQKTDFQAPQRPRLLPGGLPEPRLQRSSLTNRGDVPAVA